MAALSWESLAERLAPLHRLVVPSLRGFGASPAPAPGVTLADYADDVAEIAAPLGPYVLVGAEEYSLHEADALIDALTQLVDRGTGVSSPAGP